MSKLIDQLRAGLPDDDTAHKIVEQVALLEKEADRAAELEAELADCKEECEADFQRFVNRAYDALRDAGITVVEAREEAPECSRQSE